MSVSTGNKPYLTCDVAAEGDAELVADVQAYLTLFCRCRALIEIGDNRLAVHFEQPREAAAFAEIWATWIAAGSVPGLPDALARASFNR